MVAGVPWSQVLITLPAALAAGWVSLLYRYRGRGRPFGSARAAAWSLAAVSVTGAAAAGLALGLPAAVDQLPPVTIGLAIPTLLCAGRAVTAESPVERAVWYPIVPRASRSCSITWNSRCTPTGTRGARPGSAVIGVWSNSRKPRGMCMPRWSVGPVTTGG
jgi:hypothetical protein